MSGSNKGAGIDPRLQNITNALYLTTASDVAVRTGMTGDINISGPVYIPGTVTVDSTPEDPVHVHVTELTSGTVSLSTQTLAALESVNVQNTVSVVVSNFPTTSTVYQGTIPWATTVTNWPALQVIGGSVYAVQSGTWAVGVTGTVAVSNFTSTVQVSNNVTATITGTVSVSNFPTTSTVYQGTNPWTITGTVAVSNPTTAVTATISGSVPVTFPDASLAAFEELMTVQPFPIIQLDAVYGLETDKFVVRQIGSGSVGVENNMIYASSGVVSGAGTISSKRFIRYRPGTGTLARFTAMFTTSTTTSSYYGINGVNQQAGLINLGNGYAFGFSGLTGTNSAGSDQRQFGILHRSGGAIEIRTLTINTAPTGAQTATITLNSVPYTISLTAGTTAQCAQQIATGSTYGDSWSTDQVGNTVIFSATQVNPRSGTYSFSSTGTGILATGTIVQTTAGVANNSVWTYIDKWDRPIAVNPSKLNVFAIDMRWLGAGIVRFFMEDPTTGKMTLVHTQHWANSNTIPHIDNPSLRINYAAGILAGQTPSTTATVRGASMFGAIQGGIAQTVYSEGWYAVDTGNRVKDVVHHLISVRNTYTKSNKMNTRELLLQDLSVSIQGADPAVIFIYINPIIATGQVLFTAIPQSDALVSATSDPTIDPALNNPVVSFVLGINGTAQFDLLPYRLVLSPGDNLSVAILSTNGITRTAVSLTWATD